MCLAMVSLSPPPPPRLGYWGVGETSWFSLSAVMYFLLLSILCINKHIQKCTKIIAYRRHVRNSESVMVVMLQIVHMDGLLPDGSVYTNLLHLLSGYAYKVYMTYTKTNEFCVQTRGPVQRLPHYVNANKLKSETLQGTHIPDKENLRLCMFPVVLHSTFLIIVKKVFFVYLLVFSICTVQMIQFAVLVSVSPCHRICAHVATCVYVFIHSLMLTIFPYITHIILLFLFPQFL